MNIKQLLSRVKMPQTGAVYGIVLIIILLQILTGGEYLSFSNTENVLRQSATLSIITICSFLAIITHQTDLSVGGTASLAGIVAAMLLDAGQPVFVACFVAVLCGMAIGTLNGVLAGYTSIPTFIITLATMSISESVAMVLNKGTIRVDDPLLKNISTGSVWVIPIPLIIVLILYFSFYYILNHRRFGTYLYAVGGKEDAANTAGINVKRIKLSVYIINGALAAVAGVMYIARLSAANPSQGIGLELDGICSAVLGGAALTGGKGKISGAFLGAIAISILRNGMNRLGLRVIAQMTIIGLVLIIILAFDVFNKNREEKRNEG